MKIKSLFATFFIVTIFSVSCEKEAIKVDSTITDEELAIVSDEVIADLAFADLLDEGDDGTFWGDDAVMSLKSASLEMGTCPARTVIWEDNKKTVIREFSGEDCDKSGTIIIEFFKPTDSDPFKKKTITFEDFTKNGVTYNGSKEITKGNDNYNIKCEMEIDKVNQEGDSVHISRSYQRQVHWLCGLDTRDYVEDNIKKVTGSAEVTRTVNGVETTFSRQILSPLLIVRACDLKIQAGTVKITKRDGTEIKIDYGQMPDEIDCDVDFECGTTFEVTKGDETFTMELVDGERVRQSDSE